MAKIELGETVVTPQEPDKFKAITEQLDAFSKQVQSNLVNDYNAIFTAAFCSAQATPRQFFKGIGGRGCSTLSFLEWLYTSLKNRWPKLEIRQLPDHLVFTRDEETGIVDVVEK